MDAPLYLPAAAYAPPIYEKRGLDTANTSIASLLANPAAKAILQREVPGLDFRVGSEALNPHPDNFSMRSMVQFGLFKPDDLDRIDVLLRALPPMSGGGK